VRQRAGARPGNRRGDWTTWGRDEGVERESRDVLIAVAIALATARPARAETKQEIDQRLRAQLEREHPEALPD